MLVGTGGDDRGFGGASGCPEMFPYADFVAGLLTGSGPDEGHAAAVKLAVAKFALENIHYLNWFTAPTGGMERRQCQEGNRRATRPRSGRWRW